MPTYITLSRWTAKGVENLKASPSRLDKAKEVARAVGGEMKAFYLTMGEYDLVVVWEFPDDKAAAKCALRIMGEGGVSSQTLKAFSEAEYRQLLGSL